MYRPTIQSTEDETENKFLRGFATPDIKKEQVYDDGNEIYENMMVTESVKVECGTEQSTTNIKREVFDEFSKESSECIEERDDYMVLHTSLDIKEEVLEHMVSSEPTEKELFFSSNSETNSSENGLETIKGPEPKNSGDLFNESQYTDKMTLDCNTTGKIFKCDFCQKAFSRKGTLKSHLITHSEEKPFRCDICYKGFIRKDRLRSHQLTHSGVKPFTCDFCQKTFTRKDILEYHLFTHSGKKPFECSSCDKKFARKHDLKMHLLTHPDKKPFKCDHCSKGFTRKNRLRSHLYIHSGMKPFKCDHCEKTYTRKDTLKKHSLTHRRGSLTLE